MAPRPSEAFLSLRSDDQLARLVREGNEQAFAVIVERYRRELHAFASRMRADGRADDLVQQTFLSAFTALRGGTEVKHVRGWLYRILRNEATRTSSRAVVEVELDPARVASEPLEEFTQRRMLAFEALSSIAALPERQRHAFVASALGGESRAAVAGSMGLSEGAVRQLMHRARATLRAAAAAITPAPLANLMAGLRNGPVTNQVPEIAIGAGATPAAGVALKVGALLASGALATGIVGSQLGSRTGRHTVVREHSRQVLASAGATRAGSGSAAGRAAGASAAATRVRGSRAGATAVLVPHSVTGVAGGATLDRHARTHGGHRGSARGEGGGGGPGPSRASGGENRAMTGDGGGESARTGDGGGGSAQRSGAENFPAGSGGSITDHGTGGDRGGSSQSAAGGSSNDPAPGGDSGSASSDSGGRQGSSGDTGSGGGGSSDGPSTSSGDSSSLGPRGHDSSAPDSSGD